MQACSGCATVNPLAIYVGYHHHVVRPDYHMTPPKKGEKVNQCQEDGSELQAVYEPGEELSCPNTVRRSAFEDHAPACYLRSRWRIRQYKMQHENVEGGFRAISQ